MAKRDKFASLDTHIVLDPWYQTLNANDRGLFLTLLCNPDISMIGVYEISLPTLELYTGLGREALGHALDRFAGATKVHYVDGWIVVKNYLKNNPIKGSDKLVIGAHKRLEDIPWHIRERLVKDSDTLYIPYLDPTSSLFIGYPEGSNRVGTPARAQARALSPALSQDTPPTPSPGRRAEGTNPRARGTSLRKSGQNPRATGSNPRAAGAPPGEFPDGFIVE